MANVIINFNMYIDHEASIRGFLCLPHKSGRDLMPRNLVSFILKKDNYKCKVPKKSIGIIL
jgi:hypothetical protein